MTSRSLQHQDSKGFSVEKTCSVIKIKIEKPEDEEKEKMSFCPKGNCHVLHFLCKHELAKIAGEQGWKFILEEKDGKLVAKLLVKNETAIEECRDKLRKFITKVLPNLCQVNFDLSPLSSTTHSNSGNEASNQGSDHDNREHSDKVHSNRNHDNNDPLQKSLACLLPLVAGVQNRAHLLYNKDSNCLVITGETETVKQLYMKAKAKLYIITMKTGFRSTLQGHLLKTFGIIDRLKGQYPDVGAVLEDCNTKLSWTGTEENITICQQEMEKLIGEIKTLNFPVSAMLQKLLSVPEIKSLIDTLLLKEGIICVWQVNEARDVQVWSVKSSSAKLFELKIRENFKEQSFSVKDFPFVLEVSSSGFGLSAEEMKHVLVEETNDAVNVAAMSNTMQKIIQHLQTMEDPHSAGNSGSKERDNPAGIQKNSCTIEVRGMSQHTSDDTVELYFESRRAAGQPVDIEKFNASKREKDGVIFITYETAEVVKLVLDRQHVLDKCPLTVQLVQESESAPSKFYEEKIFFRNMNTTTTQNSLESFLRSKVQETPSEFLYGKEDGTVLVSFNGCPDFEKLKHACQQSPLDESLLEAEQVPISHCVSVYGAQEKTTCDTLECYFENRRRSGGGDVSEVKEISTGTFVITFENSSVVDRVCQRSHVVDGSTLAVQVFYQVLGFRHSYARPPLKVEYF
ncbi:uncharacterized protein [Argopecten irradians]|uniref:uncharacterized protein isoform X1 n=1 Tax=Argopecten irradians TaxID=31199 RepID=UPI0037150CB9